MKNIFVFIAALLCLYFFFGCSADGSNTEINMSFSKIDTGTIYLFADDVETKKVSVDTLKIKNGKVTIRKKISKNDAIYHRLISKSGNENKTHGNFFFAEKGELYVSFSDKELNHIEIKGSGSKTQKDFEEYQKILSGIARQSDSLKKEFEKLSSSLSSEKQKEKLMSYIYYVQNQGIIADSVFISEKKKSKLVPFILLNHYVSGEYSEFKVLQFFKHLSYDVKESFYAKKLLDLVENTSSVGKKVKDFELPAVDGKKVKLSHFAGKVVILDFWASWCSPCRIKNPELVDIYKKYNHRGLEIIGISLDTDRDSWINAIKSDKLSWLQLSDLNGWDNSVARLYGVKSIPNLILLDTSGVIVSINPQYEELVNNLDGLLKK